VASNRDVIKVMPRVDTREKAPWPVAVGDRTKKDSWTTTGTRAECYTEVISMLTVGLSPPPAHCSTLGRAMLPKTLWGPEAPHSSISHEPLNRTSQPEEDCGSRVHLTVLARQTTERGWSYPTSRWLEGSDLEFGKGDCNSRPTTPFPSRCWKPGLGDEGTLAMGETDRKVETMAGARTDTARRRAGRGSSRGLNLCLNRHA